MLILAGVSLSAVFSDKGIFKRAEGAANKYDQAKARETLELALGESRMQKYDKGLTDEQLTDKINKVGKEIAPGGNEVIVDGYIFKIDRSVPKIIDYVGQANEVIVTSTITQNGNWQTPTATVTGTITKYGGGTVTSVTGTKAAIVDGVAGTPTAITGLPTTGGNYTISDITTDTEIIITTTDSEGKTKTHKITVILVRDTTPPVISEEKATAIGLNIEISGKATDSESGVASFKYTISPTTGLSSSTGDLPQDGTPVTITSTAEATYTITLTATDNAGKTATATAGTVTTVDAMSVAETKSLVTSMSALKEHMGKKVAYKAGETWQIFYYDQVGEFGPANTLYLKRAYGEVASTALTLSTKTTGEAVERMKSMNPKWRDYPTENANTINNNNEKACVWLCDPDVWNTQRNETYSSYAIGSPSVEMYMKAWNVWKTGHKDSNDTESKNLICKVEDNKGYKVGAMGSYTWNGSDEYYTGDYSIENGPNNIFMSTYAYWWVASPSSHGNDYAILLGSDDRGRRWRGLLRI